MPFQSFVAVFSLVAVLILGARWLLAPRPPSACREPKSYPHKDPVLGLDLFLKMMEQMKAGTRRQAQQDRVRLLGPTFKSNSLGRWSVSTVDPLNAKELFLRNPHQWGVAYDRWQAMEPFIGTGFMNADGDSWKTARGQLENCFKTSNVTNLAPLEEATTGLLDHVSAGNPVDLAPLLDDMALELAGYFLFGQKMSTLSAPGPDGNRIDSKKLMAGFHDAESGLLPRLAFKPIGRFLPNPKFRSSIQIVHHFLDYMIGIAQHRQPQALGKKSRFGEGYGLVDNLLEQTSSTYAIRSQILQCLMAMEQTVPAVIKDVLWEIARVPTAWMKLRSEILNIGETNLTAGNLKKAEYLQKVIKEALRLHPPFAGLFRTAMEDTTIPTGGGQDGLCPIFCRKGSTVGILCSAMYRQEKVFGESVDAFVPDRWDHISPSTSEYAPFSTGPRRCLGEALGTFWASYVIARLALKYERLEAADERPWKDAPRLIGENANGCTVIFH